MILSPKFTHSTLPRSQPCNLTLYPDPILLEDGGENDELIWGYPPGVPTPDPALLMASGGNEPAVWG